MGKGITDMAAARKFVVYFRVSTDKQGATGLGMGAQRSSVERFIEGTTGARILEEFTEVQSGAKDDREQLRRALRRCRTSNATLLVAKLDRLSRDAAFIANLQKAEVEFVVADMPEANRLTIGLLALIAEHEREMISTRTKAGLAEAKKRGTKLGNPRLAEVRNTDTRAATAARSSKSRQISARMREVIEEMEAEVGEPMSLSAIARALNDAEYTTARGKPFTAMQVRRIKLAGAPDAEVKAA